MSMTTPGDSSAVSNYTFLIVETDFQPRFFEQ